LFELKNWSSYTLSELPELVIELIRVTEKKPNVWLFRGQMGAGKTTLIKEICAQKGVMHSVQSPTFSLVNEYQTKDRAIIYHFDLYRLKNTREALEIGIEEYLDSGNLCLIEWPEQAEDLWDLPHVNFQLSAIDAEHRKLEVTCLKTL
jgi:tRNA threonylcarbamoyladenosine biosynthesis protein TsaE